MKKITAIIQPSKLKEVKDSLCVAGVSGMTVYRTRGLDSPGGPGGASCGLVQMDMFSPKVSLEVVVPASLVPEVVQSIAAAAKTGPLGDGRIGDGSIFVSPVEAA